MSRFISVFATSIEDMLTYREALGFSRTSYGYRLMSFDHFCANHYHGLDILTRDIVFKWIEYELNNKCSNIRDKESAIRFFGRYLAAIGKASYILPQKYASHAEKLKKSPYIFTDKELFSLFHASDSIKTKPLSIAPVLFRLIYTCGLRPNEGRELKRTNINFNSGEILITKTKSKKERIVVMSDDMLSLCKNYDVYRRAIMKDSEYYFPTQEGCAYSSSQLSHLFKRCWKLANPETNAQTLPNVRIYDLRHRFASTVLIRWLNEGQNLNAMLPYLRAYMGHNNLSDTVYYIHLLPENLLKSPGIRWSDFDSLIPEVDV